MPAEETTPAIVLRARDYAESDRIVTLLTRDQGKIGGIAKGAKASRHRFERKLEPFSHVILHFRRRPHGQLVFITRAEAADLEQFRIEEDLSRIALGTYMLELTDMLTAEGGDAADAYRSLSSASAHCRCARQTPRCARRRAARPGMVRLWAGVRAMPRLCGGGRHRVGVFRGGSRRCDLRPMPQWRARGCYTDANRKRGGLGEPGENGHQRSWWRHTGGRRRSDGNRTIPELDYRSEAENDGIPGLDSEQRKVDPLPH